MSWLNGVGCGAVGIYFPRKKGFATTPAEAIGMFLIDVLESQFPYAKWGSNNIPIKYNWFSDQSPKMSIDSPAVSLIVDLTDSPKLGEYLPTSDGGMVMGNMYKMQVTFVIIAQNTKLRTYIINQLDRVLKREIIGQSYHPILDFRKDDFGWERGFNQSQQNVYTVLFQNESDMEFVQTIEYIGYILQDYVDADSSEEVFNGIIGSISGNINTDTEFRIAGGSHFSLRITYIPDV